MNKKLFSIKVSFFILIILGTLSNSVEAQFSLSGELRFRSELDHGYKSLPTESSQIVPFVSQRSRLVLNYKNSFLSTRFSIQNVGMWGGKDLASKTGVWGHSTGIDLSEAWAKLKLSKNSSLIVGRQYFIYDDQRLLAGRNWNQFSLSYDAFRYTHNKNDWQFDVGLSWNNKFIKLFGKEAGTNNYYDDGYRIKSLNFLYLKKNFGKSYVSFSVISSGVQKPETNDVFNFKVTYGPYVKLNFEKMDLVFNAFLQNGHDAIGQKVNAYMVSANTGYKVNDLRLGLGLDYISGNDASNTSTKYNQTNHAFDLLYGARFKFYGWMNYFGVLQSTTRNGGLIDFYPNVSFDFNEIHNLKLYYHLFSLQSDVLNDLSTETYLDHNLGSELDLMYTANLKKEIVLSAGFSYYMTSNTLDLLMLGYDNGNVINTSASPYWMWVMLTVKTDLFTQK